MLILEFTKVKTDLPDFRLRNFIERIKCGYLKLSAKRTISSKGNDCCRMQVKYSICSYL